jgi:amino acid adenylation domain-containing protein
VTALAAQTQTTPFVVLLGAFHLLLGRLCDVRDVIVGTPTLGRPTAEDLGVVGDFINEIPVRSRLDDAATVRGFLAEVHESLIGALEAQDFPLSLMIQRLHPAREATGQALFNTSFAMLQPNAAHSRRTVAGATFELESLPFQVGLHDLRLELIASEAGIRGVVKYSTDVFTRTAAERICAEYLALAQAVVAAPDQALGDLRRPLGEGGVDDLRAAALLAALGARDIRLGLDGERLRVDAPKGAVNDADRHAIAELRPAILARLRAGTTDAREANGAPDRTRCLHHLLEAAAAAYPERTAVAGPGGELTYAEFEARANRLAHQLVRAGVRPGVLAAVALERTVNLPVALAAVLKAGGTYVPLDPAHPRERLREIVRDAGAAVLVTEGDLGEVALGTEARVFRLDGEAATDAAWPATPPDVAVRPDDLAYVIYTSGSTGRPKGVEIEHRNLVAFLDAMRREPGLDPNDVLLAVTTISFDIAGLELWLPLSTGARVVLAARADAIDAERLAALMETHGVTVLQATPATWRLLLESGWAGRSELRALCGGEALPQALAARIAGRVGALWNMYGPTETTIWSTVARVAGAGLDAASGLVPIGRPIAGTRVFVVDEDGTPVATGVAGELLIGGEGVARGYRGRPDLTERAFVLRDDGRGPERVYRTGDLARFRADGQLEYLGRRDHQIKLRGYRIEPAEIEAALASRPELTGSLVLVDAETAGDERLVAYVTLAPGASFDPGEVQSALRARLPEYMIPSRIVALPRFPLTPAGKVDRAALALAGASPIAADPPALSRTIPAVTMTAEQARVAALWRDVLRVERVGLHDNFFDIGGHSLLLVRIQAGFKREFGIDLPLVELFERTTVARQAERLAAEARAEVPVHG